MLHRSGGAEAVKAPLAEGGREQKKHACVSGMPSTRAAADAPYRSMLGSGAPSFWTESGR